jgi:hypothetical protein
MLLWAREGIWGGVGEVGGYLETMTWRVKKKKLRKRRAMTH